MPAIRNEEKWAMEIVSRLLSVPVVAFDDGSANGMPDALIQGPSGPIPLEVFGDWDSDYLRLEEGLKKFGRRITIGHDEPAWEVALVHGVARVKTLVGRLPGLLKEHEKDLLRDNLPDALVAVGVEDARPLTGRRGYIHMSAAGWNSWDAPKGFGEWLDGLFAIAVDVPSKLAKFGGPEQHAFIWVLSLSSWSALDQLEMDGDDNDAMLPASAPDVPSSLTDVWIASTLVRPSRGILHWNRLKGWEMHKFALTPQDWI